MLTENGLVLELMRYRKQLESDMLPEVWTKLEAPVYVILSDICKTLGLSSADTASVLGVDATLQMLSMLEVRIYPVPCKGEPLCTRQTKAYIFVRQEGMINLATYRALCPFWSDETLRLDLQGMVNCGILVKHGKCKGTYYTLAEESQ